VIQNGISEKIEKKISKEKISNSFKLFRFIHPHKIWFIFGMFLLVLSSLSVLIFPYILPKLADIAQGIPMELFKRKDGSYLITCNTRDDILQLLIIILILQSILSFFRVYIFAQINERVIFDIRHQLYNKILCLPISFYEKNRVGELISRVSSDILVIQDAISINLAEFFRQIVTFLGGVIIIFILSPDLTFFILYTIPVLVLLAFIIGKFIRKLAGLTQNAIADSNVVVEETFHNINIVKAYINELFEVSRYTKKIELIKETGITCCSLSIRIYFIHYPGHVRYSSINTLQSERTGRDQTNDSW
jgi:ABC-type multidrug transport system fused ATPase/permease subunit